jgi:hypothetical protein
MFHPKKGDTYFTITVGRYSYCVTELIWRDDFYDLNQKHLGRIFETRECAEKWIKLVGMEIINESIGME